MKRNCLILLIVSLLILCGCAELSGEAPAPDPESCIGDVKILSHSGYLTTGFPGHYLEIFGELQNTGNQNLKFIKLTATFFDSAGKVIGTKWTYANTDILLPGEKAPFVFMQLISEEKDYKSYGLEVTSCREKTEEPYRNFEFLNTSSYIDDHDYYHVKGEIKNTGTQDIDFVGVILTCYNAEGKVISASGTCLLVDLKAGTTAPFDTQALPSEISSKIASYSLQTDVD